MVTAAADRGESLVAWRPAVPGVREVFHARFAAHAYPSHTHEAWTLLIVDDGAIRYGLDRSDHGALARAVTLLPPHVPHDGRSVDDRGFSKRVVYLEADVLGEELIGPAVDEPTLVDPLLRRWIHQLHVALGRRDEALHAESRLALIADRLRQHLEGAGPRAPRPARRRIAQDLRDLIDAQVTQGITLQAAGRHLHADPTHLVRAFTAAYGLPPHLYLVGRRIDRARALLLTGRPPSQVATDVGFYDQAHLARHFKRYLGTTPGRYAAAERDRHGTA